MARDYYADAREIAERLDEPQQRVWGDRIEHVIADCYTATEILMGIRFQLGELLGSDVTLARTSGRSLQNPGSTGVTVITRSDGRVVAVIPGGCGMSGFDGRAEVVIGRHESDRLSIRVLGRMHGEAQDYWDGNWLITPIEIVVGGFHGEVTASLRADELLAFREALERVDTSLAGEATLESLERWLTLRVAVDRSGRLSVTGRAIDQLGAANELSFKIEGLDQSDLAPMIEALREAGALFPVLGAP